ncbi:hypothetical protein GCM10028807_51210 [Spirosoma daeguense]
MIWYENEVQQLEKNIHNTRAITGRTVFYGSSSIRLWSTLTSDFPDQSVLNLGFGGSTLAACGWFMERILIPVQPKAIVLYAGDNDLGDGRNPEEVYLLFIGFVARLRRFLPDVPLTFLSIKTSLARMSLVPQIQKTNHLISQEIAHMLNTQYLDVASALLGSDGKPRWECFEADGLHLSPTGYRAWQTVLQQNPSIFNNLITN